jgi:hypothetical protein
MDIRPLMKVKKKNRPKTIGSVELLISLKAPIDEFTVMLLKKQTAARKRLPITKARRNKNTIFVPCFVTDYFYLFSFYIIQENVQSPNSMICRLYMNTMT